MPNKRLLIIYHSQTGHTHALVQAAFDAACQQEGVECRLLKALSADIEDLANCDGIIFGTPENFGYMSGALKDFFDRTYYPAQERGLCLPYALLVSAGNDGSGAVRHVERILTGYPMRKVAEPIVVKGEVTAAALDRCADLGQGFAVGLSLGVF